MKNAIKLVVVAVMLLAVVGVFVLRRSGPVATELAPTEAPTEETDIVPATGPLPRLIDIGRGKCEACKMMMPVLAELEAEYEGQLVVQTINLDEDPVAEEVYNVEWIPLQIFIGPDGRELTRHTGFISKESIVETLARFGIELKPPKPDIVVSIPKPGLIRRISGALTNAIEGAPAVALLAAFVWGILSILLSPCHLTSIPLIVGFIDKQGRTTTRRAALVSTAFAVGILVTIAAVGAITAAAGRMLGDIGDIGNYIVAGLFCLVALVLLDVLPMPWSGPGQVGMKKRGALAAFILGLVFGIAIGPCTFAYIAPILGVTFRFAATSLVYVLLLLFVYGVGHCSVIVLAGTFTEVVQRYLNWNERSRGAVWLKRVCGVLVFLGGLFLIYTAI